MRLTAWACWMTRVAASAVVWSTAVWPSAIVHDLAGVGVRSIAPAVMVFAAEMSVTVGGPTARVASCAHALDAAPTRSAIVPAARPARDGADLLSAAIERRFGDEA
jgi:hypothetical protein